MLDCSGHGRWDYDVASIENRLRLGLGLLLDRDSTIMLGVSIPIVTRWGLIRLRSKDILGFLFVM